MCFRRCRRDVFHFRRVIRSLFQVFLFFGYGFVDYSGLSGVFPLSSSPPPRGCCRDGGDKRVVSFRVFPCGLSSFKPTTSLKVDKCSCMVARILLRIQYKGVACKTIRKRARYSLFIVVLGTGPHIIIGQRSSE